MDGFLKAKHIFHPHMQPKEAKKEGNQIMFKPKFKPSKIELIEDVVILHFERGDIQVKIRNDIFILQTKGTMHVRITNQKVLNKDFFDFISVTGGQSRYHAMQIKAFHGITELLNEIVKPFESIVENQLHSETISLINEIELFNQENLLNYYLESHQFGALENLLNTFPHFGKTLNLRK